MYKKLKKIITLILITSTIFTIYPSININSQPIQDKCKTKNTTEVCLNNQFLFNIEGKFDNEYRGKTISERIERIANNKSISNELININNFKIETRELTSIIKFNDEIIITIKKEDAKIAKKDIEQLTKEYLNKIIIGIKEYRSQKTKEKNKENSKQPNYYYYYFLTLFGAIGGRIFSLNNAIIIYL